MSITQRADIFTRRAGGYQYSMPMMGTGLASSAATASSGFFSLGPSFNTIGSTLPGTIVGFPIPSGGRAFANYMVSGNSSATARSSILALFYKLGTVNLASASATPYNGFTHNSNFTGPITHGSGITSRVKLVPLLYVTTATVTTAPSFILQTTTGPAAGYVNQDNSNVIGTKTFTLPLAATVQGSTFILRLEDGDSSVLDITQMSVTAKGTAGVATVFGVEMLLPTNYPNGSIGVFDSVLSSVCLNDITPGSPATGSLTINTDVFLGLLNFVSTSQNSVNILYAVI